MAAPEAQDAPKAKSTPAVSTVFRRLYATDAPMTKQEVAKQCGLSLPTVYQAFTTLEEEGLIEPAEERHSTGGRRAQTFRVSRRNVATIGISLTGHSARCVACDLFGERIEGLYFKQPLAAERTRETLAASIQELTGAMDAELKQRGVRPVGVGVAVPSAIEPTTGRLLNTSVLRISEGGVCADDLTALLPYPAAVFNDANCGAYSQIFPATEGVSLAYLSLERGVGGAIIVDGKPFEGPHGTSGEFGHICIEPGGKKCACGRSGCLEAYCSSNVLSEELGVSLDEFFADAGRGEEKAAEVLQDYIAHLARGIQAIHTMLGVDVRLGGELASYLVPYFPEINAAVDALDPFPGGAPCAVHSKHPFHGVPIGAAQLMAARFIQDV